MATTKTIWGVIDKEGKVQHGSGDYSVKKESSGQYKIIFLENFFEVPAITGNQVNYNSLEQDTRDGVVFPVLKSDSVTVIVGNSGGKHEDRSFSFIAIGHVK